MPIGRSLISLLFFLLFSIPWSDHLCYGQKLGHVNYRQLIDSLDEAKNINEQLNRYELALSNVGQQMIDKFQANYKKYQDAINAGSLTSAQRQQMESDLEIEQTAIGKYQQSARESLQKRNEELLKPFLSKIDSLIKNYGKQEGYTMIFNNRPGLIITPDMDDLFTKLYPLLNKKN